MKIWYLTSEYIPDFGGGICTYIDQVSRMFASAGHSVTVFVRDSEKDVVEFPQPNLRVVRFKHMRGDYYSWLGYWTALSYQYSEVVIEHLENCQDRPDVIEVQDYSGLGYYLLQRKWTKEPQLKGLPIVVHLHTPNFELSKINQIARYKFPDYWIEQMERFCLKAASGLVAQSFFLKDKLSTYTSQKITPVIPLPYQTELPIEYGTVTEKKTDILYLGRFEYRKGVVQLLKGMDALWRQNKNIKITMIGGDVFFSPKNKKLGEILKEKYASYISKGLLEFKSSVPPDKLYDEIVKARLVVIPSLYENYPYACIMSMKLACPVLVSASGGQAEMVGEDGVNGFIFDWNKAGDFSRQVQRILSMDETQLHNIGHNARTRIDSLCNWEDNLNKRSELYQNIIDREAENRIFPTSDSLEQSLCTSDFVGREGLLSIIIPYYNLGELLLESLKSVLDTHYKDFEILIVNDGSTDQKSLDVLHHLETTKDNRISIINIDNGGLANARNVGAKLANGEYISFLDADDLVNPDYYKKAIAVLKAYDNVSFVYSWVQYFGNNTGVWPTFNTEFPYLLGMNMLSAFAVVKRNDFLKSGLNREVMEYGYEDYDGWLSMCCAGLTGISIPHILVKYRVREDSMARQFNPNTILYLFDVMSEGHSKIYQKFGVEIFNLLMANGPGYLWNNPSIIHPPIGYLGETIQVPNEEKPYYELIKMANSRLGSFIIKLIFYFKLNRLFK